MTVTQFTDWPERARIHRARWPFCHLCEKRDCRLGRFTYWVPLEVHHVYGRGVRSPVGAEREDELWTLCRDCHDRITVAHRRLGQERGERILVGNGRRRHWITNPAKVREYCDTIAEVTLNTRPRYLSRTWRRVLRGLPKELW